MRLTIYTDGGARGNPGPAAIGVAAKDEKGQSVFTLSKAIGETTNNVAEYTAVLNALSEVKSRMLRPTSTEFVLDSVLVVNQLNGLFKVKDNALRELLTRVRVLEQEVGGHITYRVVRRELNKEADALVNQALDALLMLH